MDLTEGAEPGKDPALLPVAARVLAALRSAPKTMTRIVQGGGGPPLDAGKGHRALPDIKNKKGGAGEDVDLPPGSSST